MGGSAVLPLASEGRAAPAKGLATRSRRIIDADFPNVVPRDWSIGRRRYRLLMARFGRDQGDCWVKL
jgi:hypothetical protein